MKIIVFYDKSNYKKLEFEIPKFDELYDLKVFIDEKLSTNTAIKESYQLIYENIILNDCNKLIKYIDMHDSEQIRIGHLEDFLQEDDLIVELFVCKPIPSLVHLIVKKQDQIRVLKSEFCKFGLSVDYICNLKGELNLDQFITDNVCNDNGYIKLIIKNDNTFTECLNIYDPYLIEYYLRNNDLTYLWYREEFSLSQTNSLKQLLYQIKLALSIDNIDSLLSKNLEKSPSSFINSRFLFYEIMTNRICEFCNDHYLESVIEKFGCDEIVIHVFRQYFRDAVRVEIIDYEKSVRYSSNNADKSLKKIANAALVYCLRYLIYPMKEWRYLMGLFIGEFSIGFVNNLFVDEIINKWKESHSKIILNWEFESSNILPDISNKNSKIIDKKKGFHSMKRRNMEDEEFSNKFDGNPFEHFIHSIKTGNIEDAKYYFNEEFSNRTDKYGLQPIHWASLSYNVDILKWLLKKKCNIESASRNDWRPIHFAAFAGDEEMMKCLIEKFCKLDCLTNIFKTISDVANGDCEHEFIDEILNGTNLRVALSMGLKCGVGCDHKLCLTSVARGDFGKGELIGLGPFGKVFKVRESQSDRIFAIKITEKYFGGPKFILSNINRYLTKLDHENMIKYYGKIETPTKWRLFMECLEKGSIFDEIRSTGSLSDDKIARYSKDILRAVAFLHHNKIIHRNINPRNILIDSNGRCKLTISHLSCSLANDEMITTFCGTPNYLAPEIIKDEPYNYPVDIWAVGATVIHMLAGRPPYHGLNEIAVMFRIATTRKLECIPHRQISNEMQKFIDDMIKPEPSERATADKLLNYEFLRNASINCEINNSNTDQPIIDYSIINRQRCTDLIKRTLNNQQIGLSMNLECPDRCKHKFCLTSVTAHNFQKGKQIGSGAFGNVYKINKSRSSSELAIKIIKKVRDADIEKEAKYLEYMINEYRETLEHENIVKYFGAISDQWEIFIFMEFIDGESISSRISANNHDPLPVITIKLYTKQILIGVKFLHDSKIIHRDIKGENILITKQDCIKIADFGLSRILQTITIHEKKTFCGTVNYTAPEVINEDEYGYPADIWSAGATVFEMATGHRPYHSTKHLITLINKIATTKKLEESKRLDEDRETKEFIDLMTKANPDERLTADELLKNKYLE